MSNQFKPYIDTHIHSHYSLLDGVSSPEDNVKRAKELGAPAVAITDHGVVSGVFEHYWACKSLKLKALLGCEFYMKANVDSDDMKYFHGVFIAMNKKGFENLLELCSIGCRQWRTTPARPVLSFKQIFERSEGLLFSTGCMIGICGAAQRKKVGQKDNGKPNYSDHQLEFDKVDLIFQGFKRVFKDRMFVEIGPARVTHDWDGKAKTFKPRETQTFTFNGETVTTNCLQEVHNKRALMMAERHNLPVIMASDAHMCNPKLKPIQDLLMVNAPGNFSGFHFYQTHAMIPSDEMWAEVQRDHPYISKEVFEQAIENTYKLNELVEDYTLEFKPLVPQFPIHLLENPVSVEEPVRHQFAERYKDIYKSGMTNRQFMMALVKKLGRLPEDARYYSRLKEEMKVICDNGVTDYTDYFLILADIVLAAGEFGVGVGPARGSAGGCLLSYVLGVTSLDPIKFDLDFARFLTIGRLKAGHPPDIDTDFTDRDPIVEYLFKLYGEEHMALVGAFQTIKTKAALKDIVRSELKSQGEELTNDHPVHKLCQTIDNAPQYYPSERAFLEGFEDDDGNHHPGLLEANKDLKKFLADNPSINDILFDVLEKPRHLSKHAGGVVLTPVSIDKVIPTQHWQNSKSTQVGFKVVEKIGGMKIDILGVNTLNFIWGAIKNVEKRHGIKLDPWDLPVEQDVFDMLRDGDTSTVFQFDTSVVRPFLAQIGPKSVLDLILITSVARPGGLDSHLAGGKTVAEHFIARRLGKEKPEYLDPILEPILGETYGLVIFQEQIQKIFEVVGGLTPTESDDARRAIGKKNLKVLLSIKAQLFNGAQVKYGWDLKKCESLWESFIGAANYAFNKAHATAYGVIAYACAFLKKKYNLEWWCSVLSFSDSDKVRTYLSEIESFMQSPSVNGSAAAWVIGSNNKLIPPLTLVTGIGEKAVKEVMTKSPYQSFDDYLARIDKKRANKVVTTNLILSGCFADIEGKDDPNELLKKFAISRKEEPPADLTRTEKIKKRSQLLSVASFDYVETFIDIIKSGQGEAEKWKYEFNKAGYHMIDGFPILTDPDKFQAFKDKNGGWDDSIVFVGMFSTESKMFYYNDKKTGERVGAYKLLVENNRKVVELVIWPNSLEDVKKSDFEEGALIAVYGNLRFSNFKKALELSFSGHKRLL